VTEAKVLEALCIVAVGVSLDVSSAGMNGEIVGFAAFGTEDIALDTT
jgi:hypothetical protein